MTSIKQEFMKVLKSEQDLVSYILNAEPEIQSEYIKLLLKWACHDDRSICLRSCQTLSSLSFPSERLQGVREKVMMSSAITRIITFATQGDLHISHPVDVDDIHFEGILDRGMFYL